ncbi:HK97 gp10 family phage protein [Nocardioides antri]|uniref:HK97 gp10 family phage protein n=1 Tax=Nocardioides antri TaxID=2607659 RepID=A0A5B1LUK0_9ACTN|nr:HK97 gp10 family phage protein [Nocardioides antri]KAA1424311.1 HK97 gp10 family phage protein [Nocardioides antri]
MANRTGFKVEGLTQVVRALQQMGLDVDDLKEAFSNIAQAGAESASRHAPKRTGRLAATIRGNRAKSKAVVTAGRASVVYAGPINYGWPSRNIAAAGFMQAADQEIQPQALQMLEDEINRKIREKNFQ